MLTLLAFTVMLLPQPPVTPALQPTPALPQPAQLELAKANGLLADHRFPEAAEALQRANQLANGKCFPCLEALAATHVRLGQPDAALEDANQALKVASSKEYQARAYNQIGLAHAASAKSGDPSSKPLAEAEKALRQAFAIDPGLNAARFHLAKVLIRQRRDAEADVVLDEYIKRETSGPLADQAKALKANHRRATELFSPDFNLTTLDGKTISLKSLRGKVVLLDFWATWCGPCLKALPELKEIRKKFAGRPFEVISLSVDRDKKRLEDFVKANQMTWPQYFDEGAHVSHEAFGVVTFPSYFILDGEGIVTYVRRGYSEVTAKFLTEEIQKALDKKK